MTKKLTEKQKIYGLWNSMRENGYTYSEIAEATFKPFSEVLEFFER